MKIYDVCNDLSLTLNSEEKTEPCKWIEKKLFLKGEIIDVELGFSLKHKELIYLRSESQLCLDGAKL